MQKKCDLSDLAWVLVPDEQLLLRALETKGARARAARLPSTSRAKPAHQSARDDDRRKLFRGASGAIAPRAGA
ncbi:hypothetical protein PGIGA_G00222410 [Pangasianodon gigas]|uniref:Uncharacterized protein n=1 Tax=Pangasianodon gigas TaxID=30993 RepID=A0ACC5WKW3_PANGG|nr:hypothetical protein [Pangasianodon gigas]